MPARRALPHRDRASFCLWREPLTEWTSVASEPVSGPSEQLVTVELRRLLHALDPGRVAELCRALRGRLREDGQASEVAPPEEDLVVPLEVLHRVRAIGRSPQPELAVMSGGDGDPDRARLADRPAYDLTSRAMVTFAVYDRDLLRPGDAFHGPALVDEGTSTTVVPSGQSVTVDGHGFLMITRGEQA